MEISLDPHTGEILIKTNVDGAAMLAAGLLALDHVPLDDDHNPWEFLFSPEDFARRDKICEELEKACYKASWRIN